MRYVHTTEISSRACQPLIVWDHGLLLCIHPVPSSSNRQTPSSVPPSIPRPGTAFPTRFASRATAAIALNGAARRLAARVGAAQHHPESLASCLKPARPTSDPAMPATPLPLPMAPRRPRSSWRVSIAGPKTFRASSRASCSRTRAPGRHAIDARCAPFRDGSSLSTQC